MAKIRQLWNSVVEILQRRFGRKASEEIPIQWKLGNPLPNARKAQIHPAKFEKYSMDAAHPTQVTQPKWKCYEDPEGYAVDLAISDEELVGGYSYENVYLTPDQFEVINAAPPKRSDHMHLESGQEVPPRHFGKHR